MHQPAIDDGRNPGAAGRGRVGRWELALVLVLVLVGFALRGCHPGRMSVEHFDEGVYASNLYCGPVINPDAPHSYPDRHLYAPPLLPAFLEVVLLLSGAPGSVMWVNVLAGSLTVLAVWCVVREWFGPTAAVIACGLAATSEYHIAFSRTALTDPLLCLWMLLSVYAGWKAVLTRGVWWILLAGLGAGLAWCTKYNGWLALAITGAGTTAWLLAARPSWKTALQSLAVWTATALIAWTIFRVIVASDLAEQGGYAAVSANHARYFVGAGGWWTSFRHQVSAHRQLDGWITLAGAAVVFLLGSLLSVRRFTWNGIWNSPDRPHSAAVVLFPLMVLVAGLAAGSSVLLGVGGLFGILLAIRKPSPESAESPMTAEQDEPARLAGWMSAAWFLGLLVAVPLYHPYPRLSLPWLVCCWIVAAVGIGRLVQSSSAARHPGVSETIKPGGLAALVVLLACVALLSAGSRGAPLWPARFPAWEDRTELHQISRRILADAERSVAELPPSKHPNFDAVFYVYGEPAIFYHLESLADKTFISQPAGNLDVTRPGATDSGVATYLITGMHARPDSREFIEATRSVELIGTYEYRASLLVRLDDTADADQPARVEQVRLYLLHPPQ